MATLTRERRVTRASALRVSSASFRSCLRRFPGRRGISNGAGLTCMTPSRPLPTSRFLPEGLGPRLCASPRSDPSRAAFRHDDRCELYKPSRRSSAPISPGVSQASAFPTIDSLYAAVNRRLVAFAATSGSGTAAAVTPARLSLRSSRPGVPFYVQ